MSECDFHLCMSLREVVLSIFCTLFLYSGLLISVVDVGHSLWNLCNHHPLLLANVLFFLDVNVLFWFIALLQSSHRLVILLTWIWSIRLIHSYFRRENWQWGVRQDWRFADLNHQYGKKWWWVSFFDIYLSQQVFQMGLCVPLYVVHSEDKPWSIWDFIAIVIFLSSITVAYHVTMLVEKRMLSQTYRAEAYKLYQKTYIWVDARVQVFLNRKR